MTLQDFIDLSIDNYYDCYIWDNEKEEEVYNGSLDSIPDELLMCEFSSWEINEGKIGLNIN